MMIYIGIDPPKGYAVWDARDKKFIELGTTDFWGLIELIKTWLFRDPIGEQFYPDIYIIIEDSTQNKPVFSKTLGGAQGRAAAKIAQNVGMNKAYTSLIIEFCRRNDIPHTAVRPQKGSMTKLSRDAFEKITGYQKRCSEHARDAAMLVFQR